MSITRGAVNRPVTTIIIFLALTGFGLVSLLGLGQELYPDISLPTLAVYTISPGVNPSDMEERVTKPVENAVASVQGIDGIDSTSSESLSFLTVKFRSGTDMEKAKADVREALNTVRDDFPDGTRESQIFIFTAAMLPSLRLNIYTSTKGMDLRALLEKKVIPEVQRIPGVARADLFGGRSRSVRVGLDLDLLNSLNVPVAGILQAFRGENSALPGGIIRSSSGNVTLRTTGTFEDIADIGRVVIGSRGNVPVYLSDVATIELEDDPQEEFVQAGDNEAIRLNVMKQPGYNTVDVNQSVLKALDRIKTELPGSVRFDIVEDQAIQVQDAIGGVTDSAWQGGLLAILVLLFFLRNIRSTLVVATTIPLSIIATFTLISAGGMTLNISSLLGITLAVGMFVDNAIVVLESIYRKMLLGWDRKEAAVLGTEEVFASVSASTLTTLAVFVPMLMVQGLAGVLFRDLSLSISFSLAVSLGAAITFIPVLASRLLKVEALPGFRDGKALAGDGGEVHHHSIEDISLADVETRTGNAVLDRMGKAIQNALLWLDNLYEKILSWALDHVPMVIGGAVVLLVASVGMVFLMGMEFIPETDDGQLSVEFRTRLGASYEQTSGKARQIEAIIREEAGDSIITMSSRVGDGGSNNGETNLRISDKSQRSFTIWDLASRIDHRVAGEVMDVEHSVNIEGMAALATMASGTSNPISIQISGDNMKDLYQTAQRVRQTVMEVPGTRNVQVDYQLGKPEMVLRVRRQEAVSLGLSPLEITSSVRAAYAGYTLSTFSQDGEDYDIRLMLRDRDRNSLDRIRNLFFLTPSGAKVSLESVVDIKEESGPVSISRKDRSRIITVSAGITKDYPLNQVDSGIARALEKLGTTPGVKITQAGSGSDMNESFASLFLALGAAVALVYMVMAAQFEDMVLPLIIMFSIPFSLIGLVLALLLTNTTFNILSFTGAILLAGVVVNNAIVLLDYVGILRKRGKSLRDALSHGGKTRLKPILMSVGTTLIGLIPMALGLGGGAELRAPMARAIIGGLASSTLITLVLIPCIYWIIESRRARRKGLPVDQGAPALPGTEATDTWPGVSEVPGTIQGEHS